MTRGPAPMGSLTGQTAKWYAMLAKPEHVEDVLQLIRGAAVGGAVEECFVPRFDAVSNAAAGDGPQMLAPVCLVKLAGSPDGLLADMKRTSALRRFAGRNAEFVPLSAEAAAWVDDNTVPGERTFGMSEGHMENGSVTVTSGPLVGHESWINKVSHRKKRAFLQIDVFGPAIDAEMGLKIVGKR